MSGLPKLLRPKETHDYARMQRENEEKEQERKKRFQRIRRENARRRRERERKKKEREKAEILKREAALKDHKRRLREQNLLSKKRVLKKKQQTRSKPIFKVYAPEKQRQTEVRENHGEQKIEESNIIRQTAPPVSYVISTGRQEISEPHKCESPKRMPGFGKKRRLRKPELRGLESLFGSLDKRAVKLARDVSDPSHQSSFPGESVMNFEPGGLEQSKPSISPNSPSSYRERQEQRAGRRVARKQVRFGETLKSVMEDAHTPADDCEEEDIVLPQTTIEGLDKSTMRLFGSVDIRNSIEQFFNLHKKAYSSPREGGGGGGGIGGAAAACRRLDAESEIESSQNLPRPGGGHMSRRQPGQSEQGFSNSKQRRRGEAHTTPPWLQGHRSSFRIREKKQPNSRGGRGANDLSIQDSAFFGQAFQRLARRPRPPPRKELERKGISKDGKKAAGGQGILSQIGLEAGLHSIYGGETTEFEHITEGEKKKATPPRDIYIGEKFSNEKEESKDFPDGDATAATTVRQSFEFSKAFGIPRNQAKEQEKHHHQQNHHYEESHTEDDLSTRKHMKEFGDGDDAVHDGFYRGDVLIRPTQEQRHSGSSTNYLASSSSSSPSPPSLLVEKRGQNNGQNRLLPHSYTNVKNAAEFSESPRRRQQTTTVTNQRKGISSWIDSEQPVATKKPRQVAIADSRRGKIEERTGKPNLKPRSNTRSSIFTFQTTDGNNALEDDNEWGSVQIVGDNEWKTVRIEGDDGKEAKHRKVESRYGLNYAALASQKTKKKNNKKKKKKKEKKIPVAATGANFRRKKKEKNQAFSQPQQLYSARSPRGYYNNATMSPRLLDKKRRAAQFKAKPGSRVMSPRPKNNHRTLPTNDERFRRSVDALGLSIETGRLHESIMKLENRLKQIAIRQQHRKQNRAVLQGRAAANTTPAPATPWNISHTNQTSSSLCEYTHDRTNHSPSGGVNHHPHHHHPPPATWGHATSGVQHPRHHGGSAVAVNLPYGGYAAQAASKKKPARKVKSRPSTLGYRARERASRLRHELENLGPMYHF
eukprot:jgi/Bigna1/72312/fgenesh1_pg.19_\